MLSREDYLYFTDRALTGMAAIVSELGDERANRRAYPEANTPYALLHHCLGVIQAWAGGFVRGRAVDRDRDAEFTATGDTAELLGRCETVRKQLHEDVLAAEPQRLLLREPPADFLGPPTRLTQGGALQHVFEELAQHHGQMETLRDLLIRPKTFPDPARLRDGHGAKWTAVEPDVLPAWVADMDLGIPEPVRARLLETIDRQDLGYPYWPGVDPVVAAFTARMHDRFGWQPRGGRTRVLSDLIQILQIVIEHTTAPGDPIALHVPTYPPFLAAIHRAGRRIVALPLEPAATGWRVDLDRHREIFAATRPRLLVLVNPHNPTGHTFRDTELRGLAELAVTHRIPVLSDEIHADLTFAPHRHIPFAALDPAVAELTITATSATKAFNLAGTRCAVVHIGHTPTAEALDRAPLDYFGTPSVLSRIATVAAWQESGDWHRSVLRLLTGNRDRVTAWARRHPGLDYIPPEATYLAWLGFARTGLPGPPAPELLKLARVHLSAGDEFTQHTSVPSSSFARLNFATSTDVLDTILHRLDAALEQYS